MLNKKKLNKNTGCSLRRLLDALRARLPAAGYSPPLTAADVRDLASALVSGPIAAGDARLVRRGAAATAPAEAAVSPSALSGALERALSGEAEEEGEGGEGAAPPPPPPPPSPAAAAPQGGRGRGGRGRTAAPGPAPPTAPPSASSPPSASPALLLVPSIAAWRSAVGLADDVLSPHSLSAVQLEALERVARCRSRGVLRSELGRSMGVELKNFHYVANHLSERGAVSATPALLAARAPGRPPSSTTRLHPGSRR